MAGSPRRRQETSQSPIARLKAAKVSKFGSTANSMIAATTAAIMMPTAKPKAAV
jgi:hypothetical protein